MNNLLASLISVGLSIIVAANDPDPVQTENQVLCDLLGLATIRRDHFTEGKQWYLPKKAFLEQAEVRFPRAMDMIQNKGHVYSRLCGLVIDVSKTHKFVVPEWGAIYGICKYLAHNGLIRLPTEVPPAPNPTGILTKLSSEIQRGRSIHAYALTIELYGYELKTTCNEMLDAANAGKDHPLSVPCKHVLHYLKNLSKAILKGSTSAENSCHVSTD